MSKRVYRNLLAARLWRLPIDIKKRKIVDMYLQAVRDKMGRSRGDARQKTMVLLHDDGKFAAAGRGKEDGVSTGSLGRASEP